MQLSGVFSVLSKVVLLPVFVMHSLALALALAAVTAGCKN